MKAPVSLASLMTAMIIFTASANGGSLEREYFDVFVPAKATVIKTKKVIVSKPRKTVAVTVEQTTALEPIVPIRCMARKTPRTLKSVKSSPGCGCEACGCTNCGTKTKAKVAATAVTVTYGPEVVYYSDVQPVRTYITGSTYSTCGAGGYSTSTAVPTYQPQYQPQLQYQSQPYVTSPAPRAFDGVGGFRGFSGGGNCANGQCSR